MNVERAEQYPVGSPELARARCRVDPALYDAERAIACPACLAQPGEACESPNLGMHHERQTAWEQVKARAASTTRWPRLAAQATASNWSAVSGWMRPGPWRSRRRSRGGSR